MLLPTRRIYDRLVKPLSAERSDMELKLSPRFVSLVNPANGEGLGRTSSVPSRDTDANGLGPA